VNPQQGPHTKKVTAAVSNIQRIIAVVATGMYRTVRLTLLKTTGLKSPLNDAPIGHPPAPSFLDMYDTYKNIIGQRRQELLVFF
jgi:hypothetical protein